MKFVFVLCLALLATSSYADDYDETFSKEVAFHLGKIGYCEQEDIDSWTCPSCHLFPDMIDVKTYSGPLDGHAFCGYEPTRDLITFAYRGSSSLTDWLNNINLFYDDYPGCDDCKVHRGFYYSYQDTETGMLECFEELRAKYPNAKSVATGHSLGATSSTFFVVKLWEKYQYKIDYYYNFESPRAGNYKLAEYVDSVVPQAHRVVHDRDIVVHLPPYHWGYQHINTEVFYNDGMTSYKVCPDTEQWDCSWQFWWMNIDDHTEIFGEYSGCGDLDENSDRLKIEEITNPMILEMLDERNKYKEHNFLRK